MKLKFYYENKNGSKAVRSKSEIGEITQKVTTIAGTTSAENDAVDFTVWGLWCIVFNNGQNFLADIFNMEKIHKVDLLKSLLFLILPDWEWTKEKLIAILF